MAHSPLSSPYLAHGRSSRRVSPDLTPQVLPNHISIKPGDFDSRGDLEAEREQQRSFYWIPELSFANGNGEESIISGERGEETE